MPKANKQTKKQQKRAAHAWSIKLLHQSRLASPTASTSPNPGSSAASTPPISSAGSEIELADIDAQNQSDIDGRSSIASSPHVVVISDFSDAENVDDGYGSDDLMSEMDGEELKESLQLQMQGGIEVLEQPQDAKIHQLMGYWWGRSNLIRVKTIPGI
jgi:DNA-binding NarL/FixJ family response regulator